MAKIFEIQKNIMDVYFFVARIVKNKLSKSTSEQSTLNLSKEHRNLGIFQQQAHNSKHCTYMT